MWHRLLGMLYKQWHRKLSQNMYTNIDAKYLLPLEVYYSVYCTDFRVAYIYLHIMHLLQVKSEWSPRAMKYFTPDFKADFMANTAHTPRPYNY